jgi:benzoyl-CoA reductase subunit B
MAGPGNGREEGANGIVGRGAREGRRLFADWYLRLTQLAERDEGAAYVFVMGSLAELLRTFDVPVTFPEINSLQTAVRDVSASYLSRAEDDGFSPDVCGYVKADYALQLEGGRHPMGRIPKPSMAVLTNACSTYIKWAEIWERLHPEAPIFTFDVPGSRDVRGGSGPTAEDRRRDLTYVEGQLRELIELLEERTGTDFDIDRLREVLDTTNRMSRAWRRVLELNRGSPAAFDAMMEGTVYLGVANALRGSPEATRYFEDLVEETEHKLAQGVGPVGRKDEHRLVFVGVPCYPIFRRFYELFTEWNGVFVTSTYTWFASGGLHADFEYDLTRPVESLAEGLLVGVQRATDAMLFHDRELLDAIDHFGADGVVYHPVKSCRTVSTGLADSRRVVLEQRDVQCLYIESDMMDDRVVSEAQLKNRIDAFFEGLQSRRIRMGRPAAATL